MTVSFGSLMNVSFRFIYGRVIWVHLLTCHLVKSRIYIPKESKTTQHLSKYNKIKNNIKGMGINIFSKNYVSSTNDYLNYSYIRDQAPIVVLSNNQRNPRGRRGRKWVNFQGSSLGFSLCLKFDKSLLLSVEVCFLKLLL